MSPNPLVPSTYCGTSFADVLGDCETPHEVERWVHDLSEGEIETILNHWPIRAGRADQHPPTWPASS